MRNIDFLYVYWKIAGFIYMFEYESFNLNFIFLDINYVKCQITCYMENSQNRVQNYDA